MTSLGVERHALPTPHPGAAPNRAPSISVAIAVYGCRDALPELHQRVTAALRQVTNNYEIVFVDDCSPDLAWAALRKLADQDPHVKAVRLSRNFGQHAAITAALAHCSGDWTVVMDCDLEDRPEEIPRLYEKAMEGYDVVLARRQERHTSRWRRALASIYFALMRLVLGFQQDGSYGTFSIMSRKVRDAFLAIRDKDRHFLFILHWLGFEQTAIEVTQAPRHSGRSSYSFGRLLQHSIDGMFFQTTTLLRWIVTFGFLLAASGGILAAVFIYLFLAAHPPAGWTSVIVAELVIGGFIIMSTGVTGIYIGKVFQQVKDRPLFVVDSRLNLEDQVDHAEAAEPLASAL